MSCRKPPLPAAPMTARRVALSSATLMAESALRVGLTAGVSFWIARSLGPEQFGLLNFASALMAIFLGVSALGLEIPLVLRLVQGQSPGPLFAAALLLRAGAAIGALACCAAIGFALHADDPQALAVTLIVALALLGYVPSVFDCWFKARVEAVAPSVVRLTATVLSLTAKLACLAWGGGVVALADGVTALVNTRLDLVERDVSRGTLNLHTSGATRGAVQREHQLAAGRGLDHWFDIKAPDARGGCRVVGRCR